MFDRWLDTGTGPIDGASIAHQVEHDPEGEMVILVLLAAESLRDARRQVEASPLVHFGALELTGLADAGSG